MSFVRFAGAFALTVVWALSSRAADWVQWRGPDRAGLSPDVGLLKDWNAQPPKLLFALSRAIVPIHQDNDILHRYHSLTHHRLKVRH